MPHADLYYHVTPEVNLPHIRELGLLPSAAWAGAGSDEDSDDDGADMARVFLCDGLRGAERYRAFIGRHAPAIVLVIPVDALTDVEADEAMKGDCYVGHPIPAEHIEILHPDGTREPLATVAPSP